MASKLYEHRKKGGYKYSFLKQYLGAVKHIVGIDDEVVSVADLLDSSEMARAAQIVANSFYEKMDDVTAHCPGLNCFTFRQAP